MHESSPQGRTVTYQITQLIGQLQQLVQGASWSYRLEEIHTLLGAWADAWACHQRQVHEPMLEALWGQGAEDYPRPRGLPTVVLYRLRGDLHERVLMKWTRLCSVRL
jgi:hypothetical protein